MFLKNRIIKMLSFITATFLIILIIIFPDISNKGVSRGLVISANVIIPSMFPFMVCVLIILKSQVIVKNAFVKKILHNVFGHDFNMFFVFLLSMLGGYPVGARLINEIYEKKIINNKTADIMLMYCVNAGPAFITAAIGKGVFNSYKIGAALLLSHLGSSFIIAIICGRYLRKYNTYIASNNFNLPISFSETFVTSVSDAASSILKICSFIILFSAINAYVEYFFADIGIIKNIIFFTEVTTAVTKTNNIIFVAFLLGFSGVSIWCQIFAMSGKRKINLILFMIGRILHGGISSIIICFLLRHFNIKIPTYSNNVEFLSSVIYSDIEVSISLVIMLLVLLTFIYSKNSSRKIINDML